MHLWRTQRIQVAGLICVLGVFGGPALAAEVNFNRDVRPILSDHCFACHGPDEHDRQADLRLDTADGIQAAVNVDSADRVERAASELVLRVLSTDPDMVMPPADFHKPLSQKQKDVLKDWVLDGAKYQQHWSFISPTRPEVDSSAATPIDGFLNCRIAAAGLVATAPADKRTLLRRVCLDLTGLPPDAQQIETFLSDDSDDAYEKLVDRLIDSPSFGEQMGRYWLDLVRYADTHGLHLDNYREMWPYRDWVIDAFNDNMPLDQFYTEQLAGDLLPDATDSQKIASGFNRLNVTTNEGGSIYDEVFARNVMDRTDAFGTIFLSLTTGCAVCHDHKFDPITQADYYSLSAFFNSLDGRALDLNVKDPAPVLRVPSDEQKQRLKEIDEELPHAIARLSDPIETVDQAQRQWEQTYSPSAAPVEHILQPSQVTSAANKKTNIRKDGSFEITKDPAAKDTLTLVATLPSEALPAGAQWQTLRLDGLVDKPDDRPGLSSNGNVVLSEIVVETASSSDDPEWHVVPIDSAIADVEQGDGPFAVSYAFDGKVNGSEGWAVDGHRKTGPRTAWFMMPTLVSGTEERPTLIRVQLKFQSVHAAHQFRRMRCTLSDSGPTVPKNQRITFGDIHSVGPFAVESASPGYGRKFASQEKKFDAGEVFNYNDRTYRWQHRADLLPVQVNALPKLSDRSSVTVLHQKIHAPKAQKATLLIGTDDGHQIFLNGKRIAMHRAAGELKPLHHEYDVDLKKGDNRLYVKVINHNGESRLCYAWRSPAIEAPSHLVQLLSVPAKDRSAAEQTAIQKYYRAVHCQHPDWLALIDLRNGLQKAREKLIAESPTTLVWKELAKPREAHILNRGQYDQPGDVVPRTTPSFLPPLPVDAPLDRLGLARWLCSPDHPLTARVAVNRFWQQIFGMGLVKTSEDFGSQGDAPTHPQLLDHLAVEFRESGWDVKQLIKSLVMTEAYGRDSQASDSALQVDPENRLFARGPRYRLDAEVLRDQALELAGLLRKDRGGPSVKPPQPDGLWYAVGYSRSNTAKFTADKEDDKIYRRSVYIFWKRTSAPPQMSTFDAPSRESCTARRERTNTPLQALLLMNEVQYLQAAKSLAVMAQSQTEVDSDQQRIEWLFQKITIRPPTSIETDELQGLLVDLKRSYAVDLSEAKKLVGKRSADLAAWTVLASTLLNLDEVVSK
ncbi:Planctomycete cytochrome C [Planctomycetes bacterium K23_9]|uniref:Planctomycete cytochrome C n=2 Tax=Stieleria marina TaxID=1930275 RepID=A0A517P2M1_9BACT|nr:Planctomycete cytochrome C [Planctomycetes bacterium K23_9]